MKGIEQLKVAKSVNRKIYDKRKILRCFTSDSAPSLVESNFELCNMVQVYEFLGEILKCDHLTESH